MRRSLLLACLIFGSYAYFYQGGGWNQNTRFDLVRAIVETGSTRIDAYHENTGDKAVVGDHHYTDKAPGASFVAVPGVAALRLVQRLAGIDVFAKPAIIWQSYVATLFGAALPAAFAAFCLFWIASWAGADEKSAAVAALVAGLATPMWAYATILYGHALAAGCVVGAFAGAIRMQQPGSPRRDYRLALLTGMAAGWSVVTEYPSAVPVVIILALGAWQIRGSGRPRLIRLTVGVAIGLGLAAAALAGYSLVSFGSPFHIGYSSEPGYEGMRRGIFGISWPRLDALREILFGSYRGLIPLAPVLILAPAGFWLWLRNRSTAPMALAAAGIVVYYFAITSGYAYWEGGWSYGSRHLAPALPFLGLAIAPVWQRGRVVLRTIIVALFIVSAGQSLVAVSTTAQPPGRLQHPMRDLLWPAFRVGELAIYWQSVLDYGPPEGAPSQLEARGVPRAAWNVGQKVGFAGHASLIPLVLFWIAGGVLWASGTREPEG